MQKWDLPIALDPAQSAPLYLQLARGITEGIRRGRLTPQTAIPSSRRMAEILGVHRNTVLAAYDELQAEGWLCTEQGRGTFVSPSIPFLKPSPSPLGPRPLAFDLNPLPEAYHRPKYPPGTLVLEGGTPDLRLLPTEELTRAYRRTLQENGSRVLAYADPQGNERLRKALADMLVKLRGLSFTPEEILVTRGSQMAIYLVARTLLQPGDTVAVEALGYPPVWDVFRSLGVRLCPIPLDQYGLDVAALEQRLAHEKIRALYLTSHHQYPTTVTLEPGRRLRLLALAHEHRFAIIEDDFDHEFHFDGQPVLPLASADPAGSVVYVGTLSKILAPGLRLGYLAGPRALIEHASLLRLQVDRQGDQLLEEAIARLIEEGDIQRHVRRMRRVYRERRDAMAQALERTFGTRVAFEVPPGGMALWVAMDPSIDTQAWSERARHYGVGFSAEQQFSLDKETGPHVRLGFACLTVKEAIEALRRMQLAL